MPGHHFQIAIQQESRNCRYRKLGVFGFNSAYIESWALYAERLAEENGWYEGDLPGRLGYLHLQLFRARRLVADTGLHAMKWTRQRGSRHAPASSVAPATAPRAKRARAGMPDAPLRFRRRRQTWPLLCRGHVRAEHGDALVQGGGERVVTASGGEAIELLDHPLHDGIAWSPARRPAAGWASAMPSSMRGATRARRRGNSRRRGSANRMGRGEED